ncbi:hypothetical protein [Lysinibacillus fusiformis]
MRDGIHGLLQQQAKAMDIKKDDSSYLPKSPHCGLTTTTAFFIKLSTK